MLRCVTFTGIDNHTDINQLIKLQEDYPFAEFGVLVSAKNTNMNSNPRFPHLGMLKGLKGCNLNLSCHVCGSAAREILAGHWEEFLKLTGKELSLFKRIQLNVGVWRKFSRGLEFLPDKDWIIQIGLHPGLYEYYQEQQNVFALQDHSGGMGSYINEWTDLGNKYCGYAGGLSAENIEEAILAIMQVHQGGFWVDMESSVRTDDWFDIEKCRHVLERVRDYVE